MRNKNVTQEVQALKLGNNGGRRDPLSLVIRGRGRARLELNISGCGRLRLAGRFLGLVHRDQSGQERDRHCSRCGAG